MVFVCVMLKSKFTSFLKWWYYYAQNIWSN